MEKRQIVITNKEINAIREFKKYPLEKKVMYFMLIVAKMKDGFTLENIPDVINLMDTRETKNLMINAISRGDIWNREEVERNINFRDQLYWHIKIMIQTSTRYFEYHKDTGKVDILYLDDSERGFKIDTNKLQESYRWLIVKRFPTVPNNKCARCGAEFSRNNNKQKYCKICAKIVLREQKRDYMRKVRLVEQ